MMKHNLVLVHSFPTNSILLRGLIEYLSDYFNVHFVDLPGFTKGTTPLPHITLSGYSAFLEEKINELGLETYLVAGISFGFAVVNKAKHSNKCLGILAIEPYIGTKSLQKPRFFA